MGAALPTPTHKQYILPLLPPIFIALSLALTTSPPGRLGKAALAGFCLLGLVPTVRMVTHVIDRGPAALMMDDRARWVGERLTAVSARGAIATLSPDSVIDSGYPLDARFSTGPFVFRSGAMLTGPEARQLRVATPDGLSDEFDTLPPAAILTGYERARKGSLPSDFLLSQYAVSHRYVRFDLPDGTGRLYINSLRSSLPDQFPVKSATPSFAGGTRRI